MAINVSVQYNGGLLPDIILLTQCYYHRGTRLNFKCHEDVLSLQPMIPFFPLYGMLRSLDAFRFYFEQQQQQLVSPYTKDYQYLP